MVKLGCIAALGLAGLALLISGCAESPLVRRTSEPMLTLILSIDPDAGAADSALTGLLATTGTPVVAEYRASQLVRLERVSDGASFDLQTLPLAGEFKTPGTIVTPASGGNLRLPWAGANGLGRRDLGGGSTYALHIETEGRTIDGVATLPATPTMRLVTLEDGRTAVAWTPVSGAARYLINADTDLPGAPSTDDTLYILRYDRPAAIVPENPRVVLTAIDENVWMFLRDTLTVSAGITGSYGVFGGTSSRSINVPRVPD